MPDVVTLPAIPPSGGRLLLVDDDQEIRTLLSGFLASQGYSISCAPNGAEMRAVLERQEVDLIILDLMLPGEDGLSLCKSLRASSSVPIIMLTAMGEEVDRILGLEFGADDYVTKPFSARELLARIKGLMRRIKVSPEPAGTNAPVVTFAGWKLDPRAHSLVAPNGEAVDLSVSELDLIMALSEAANRILTRDQLLDLTRGRMASPIDRVIDVQISRVRRKLAAAHPSGADLIRTIRGAGYMFAAEVRRA